MRFGFIWAYWIVSIEGEFISFNRRGTFLKYIHIRKNNRIDPDAVRLNIDWNERQLLVIVKWALPTLRTILYLKLTIFYTRLDRERNVARTIVWIDHWTSIKLSLATLKTLIKLTNPLEPQRAWDVSALVRTCGQKIINYLYFQPNSINVKKKNNWIRFENINNVYG